ncbi:MAG: transposase [Actinomycetia bacterium]|nr:transposase [Actinomycetes bacterium]
MRRRERPIGIFPNQASAFRLIGALLLEQDEIWTEGRKYLDMEEYWEWMETQGPSEEKVKPVLERVYEFAH